MFLSHIDVSHLLRSIKLKKFLICKDVSTGKDETNCTKSLKFYSSANVNTKSSVSLLNYTFWRPQKMTAPSSHHPHLTDCFCRGRGMLALSTLQAKMILARQ